MNSRVSAYPFYLIANGRITLYDNVLQYLGDNMTKPISVRLDDEKLQVLDALAAAMDRDRSYLINEAVDDYLEIQQWQLQGIDRAIADADAGKFASEEEVQAAFEAFKTKPGL